MLDEALSALSPADDGSLAMVALGTPHFSVSEFERLAGLIGGRHVAPGLALYISTSRFVAEIAE